MYPGRGIYNIFLKHKLFANACDIARIQIVNKYGGLYSDLGWAMTKNIKSYLNNFDIMFNGETAEWCRGYISHNVIYSREADHIIFTKMLYYIENIDVLNEYNRERSIYRTHEIVTPRFIMAAIPGLCKNDKLIVLTNSSYTFDRYHNFSHKNGLYGSSIIGECIADVDTEYKIYIAERER